MPTPAAHIFWLAGENSGDLHASLVMKSLNAALPGLRHSGIGGSRMQREGLKPLFPFARFNVMGFTEVLGHLGFFLKVERGLRTFFKTDPPDLAILVDYPGFNLRIARLADSLRVPVLYFICPQFWAWKHHRVFQLRDSVRHVACILPFEPELLAIHNVSATYVGHPIAGEVSFELDRAAFASFYGLDPAKRWIGLLPGSRDSEVKRMLPVYLKAARELAAQGFEPLVSKALSVSHGPFMACLDAARIPELKLIDGYRYDLMRHADLLVCTSGTVTLEAAYIGTPQLICYKTSALTYAIGRRLVRVKRIGLPNILLDRDLLPELIQSACTPQNIVQTALELLNDPSRLERMRSELARLREIMAEPVTSVEMPRLVREILDAHA
ncbi:MAG: lipid-A-disaccharide synthase [Candidatus Cloacimonetes bacterium]|nr:lipid-A-disaccharide synthase [Candidatus Cloacimonadota bacterium]MDY0366969.1 lipid-A-disaccharide synthase [Candidatus Syntrophosphaera sp.]